MTNPFSFDFDDDLEAEGELDFDPAIFDNDIFTTRGTPLSSIPSPSPSPYSIPSPSPSPSIPSPIYSSPSPEVEPIIQQPTRQQQARKSPRQRQQRERESIPIVLEPEEIDDLNNLLKDVPQKVVNKKSPNYKIGYEKRKNNKIYVKDIEKYEKIYAKTLSEVFPVYKMLYENQEVTNNSNENLSEKYAEKIMKDYEDNRGNCQTQTKDNKFQTDEKGKYIYSDQILRSHSFNSEKGSKARKCFLELDSDSTRLKKREKEIFTNVKLFILENGDDFELKVWYEERKLEKDYENLKKEWNDWKKGNENIVSKFKIIQNNSREELLQVLDRNYKNFDDFLKDSTAGDDDVKKLRTKMTEIYEKDLDFFLTTNNLNLNNVKKIVSRYDLKRKLKKKEDGKIVIYDSENVYFSIPEIKKKIAKKKCSGHYKLKRKNNTEEEMERNCEEQLSKKFDLINYSKSQKKIIIPKKSRKNTKS